MNRNFVFTIYIFPCCIFISSHIPSMFPADIKLRVLRILNLSRKQLFVLLSNLNWERGKVGKR